MSPNRYGEIGTALSLLAIAGLIGSFFIPLPGRPEPGFERDLMMLVQEWCRILLFYGSCALLIAAVVCWTLGRQRR